MGQVQVQVQVHSASPPDQLDPGAQPTGIAGSNVIRKLPRNRVGKSSGSIDGNCKADSFDFQTNLKNE